MNEDKEMEKTPAIRTESTPAVKEEAGLPVVTEMEKTVEEKKEVHVDSPEADVEIHIIDDRDQEAEALIHWAAARAGVIVAAPMLGTVSLVANEVYMISKIGSLYGVNVSKKAILSFLGSLGATVVGTTLATLIPLPLMQIPIGISVTYGVGKAAQKWIKDGMPDDTTPYREVFEEEKEKGAEEVEELKNDPKKDEPLGDEKQDFTKEIQKTWSELYPAKAHDAVDRLAHHVTESAVVLGEKLIGALKKAGVTDEQIEKAKYTALGASEVAQETAEKTAKDLQAIARIKSRELKREASRRAEEMRAQAKEKMEVLKKKTEEAKYRSEVQSEQLKLQSEKLKAQARVQMQEAKLQANKLKVQALEQKEIAEAKAQEISDKVKETTEKYKEAATIAAKEAKENFRSVAEEYKSKIEERAELKRKEALEKEGKSAEKSVEESNGESKE